MMLVDTNVIGELSRKRPDSAVQRWAANVAEPFAISVVTLEEIRFGLAWKPNGRIEAWFDRFFEERCAVLAITELVAHRAGQLRGHLRALGQTRTQADMLIAATAHVHQLPLATRNVRDFEGCGLALVDPFASAPS